MTLLFTFIYWIDFCGFSVVPLTGFYSFIEGGFVEGFYLSRETGGEYKKSLKEGKHESPRLAEDLLNPQRWKQLFCEQSQGNESCLSSFLRGERGGRDSQAVDDAVCCMWPWSSWCVSVGGDIASYPCILAPLLTLSSCPGLHLQSQPEDLDFQVQELISQKA